MKKRALASALLKGIRGANIEYQDMSGGSWLSDYGAESFLVYHLMKKGLEVISETQHRACATMEERFSAIAECSMATRKPGPLPSILDGNFRADIVFWKNQKYPFGVVEAKRRWEANPCLKDIKRLQALMERYGIKQKGTIQFACLAVFVPRANDPQGKAILKLYKKVEQYLKNKGVENFRFHTLSPVKDNYEDRNDTERHYSSGGMLIEFY